MIIYPPLIELQEGRCVSLHRGRTEEPQIWHVDPVKRAQEFVEAGGAEAIHVTDFDAMDGDDRNADLIREIIRAVHVPVTLGGAVSAPWSASKNGSTRAWRGSSWALSRSISRTW